MAQLVPVDHDPFAKGAGPQMVPVEHDPFANFDRQGQVSAGTPSLAQDLRALPGGIVNGIPVVGPAAEDWISSLADAVAAHVTGKPYGEIKAHNDMVAHDVAEAAPGARDLGKVIGGVSGYGAAAAAAPALFGAGAAPLLTRTIASGLTNAAIGGADSAARGGSTGDILTGAGIGAGLGTLVPGVGKLAGALARPMMRGLTRMVAPGIPGIRGSAANVLGDALLTDSAVQNVPARLRELGPDARLSDAGPTLRGVAAGISRAPGEPRTLILSDLKARDAGASGRILSDLDQNLGPATHSPIAETNLVKAQKKVEGQVLPGIFQAAPPVDIRVPLGRIGQGLIKAVGPEKAALQKMWDYLTEPLQGGGRQAINDAETLHNAKDAIDTMVKYGDASLGIPAGALAREQGTLSAVRKQLNQALRDQVPGYGDVMDKLASLNRQGGQIKAGTEILRGGEATIHPQDLAAEMAGLSPEEQAAKRLGARAAIDRTVRTNPNDRLALKQVTGGQGDFKRANLETMFGAGPAGEIGKTADREATFFDTKHRIVDNSETAPGQAAAKAMNPPPDSSLHLGPAVAAFGGADAGATYLAGRGFGKLIEGVQSALRSGRNSDLARAYISGNAATLADALMQRANRLGMAGQSVAPKVDALARALLGYEGSVRKGSDLAPLALPAAVLGGAALNRFLPATSP